jgi:hypothetical protein
MARNWQRHDAGFFHLELPSGWVVQHPNAGTLLLQDPDSKINVTLLAVSKAVEGTARSQSRGAAPVEARIELQKWIETQRHVQVRQAPRLISGAPYPTATTEGLQQRRNVNGPWYRRLISRLKRGRRRLLLWRFWGILNPHLMILANCYGQPPALEKQRATIDRMIASIRLPEHELLMGRPFAEAVASLSRSCFPRAAVSVIDETHLQFGPLRVALGPLHRRYLAHPEELSSQVRAYLMQAQEAAPASTMGGTWMRAREHVMPIFLTEKNLAEAGEAVVREEWINGLAIGYVLEEESADQGEEPARRVITQMDLTRWHKDSQELHGQALHNLVLRSREQIMEGRRADGLLMLRLAHPDRHNAARILLPELHQKLREHLGATFYAAMPAADILVAFNSSDAEILTHLRRDLEHDFRSAREPLSPKFFQVTPDGIAGDPIDAEDSII